MLHSIVFAPFLQGTGMQRPCPSLPLQQLLLASHTNVAVSLPDPFSVRNSCVLANSILLFPFKTLVFSGMQKVASQHA